MRAGIDIGGTKTNMGLFDGDGLVKSRTVPTGAPDEIVRAFAAFASELCPPEEIESIGAGVPGTVESGRVLFAPNLGWRDVDMGGAFGARFSAPFSLGQDTKCAALGEYYHGAGRGLSDLLCITIGTGIGCGLILGGTLLTGKWNTAGEFGHTIAVPGGRACGCGRRGCLEAYASGTGMARTYREYAAKGRVSPHIAKPPEHVRTEDLFAAAKAGCEICNEIIGGAVHMLAAAVIGAVNLLGPEAVIFSGGISRERELFIAPLLQEINGGVYSLLTDKILLTTAALGADAPMYGAASLYRLEEGEKS